VVSNRNQRAIATITYSLCVLYTEKTMARDKRATPGKHEDGNNNEDIHNILSPPSIISTSGLIWKNLSVGTTTTLDDVTYLLRNCSGKIPNGHLCGLLGPSGAGKVRAWKQRETIK
jgi:ABC-type glutathione transport system ATPase component